MDQITNLKSVRQLCELHPAALDFALADQIEHLSDLLDATERSASEFFAKNYVTGGMRDLLRDALARLNGNSDQAVLELRQVMGGGKTHSMLALGLLARNPSMREYVPADVLTGISRSRPRLWRLLVARSRTRSSSGVKLPSSLTRRRPLLGFGGTAPAHRMSVTGSS